jgi:hypothetical protein
MTRGSVIIPSVILVAGRALAMSASFWAGILRCSGTSPAFTIAGALKGTASLRFAMRGYNEPKFAHGGSTVPYAARVQGA